MACLTVKNLLFYELIFSHCTNTVNAILVSSSLTPCLVNVHSVSDY